MREVAEKFKVSIDAVTYVLRKLNIPRRSFSEINRVRFEQKPLSFKIRRPRDNEQKMLEAIGAMLYWAEGYKTQLATGIDFANSDPQMVALFMRFLRSRYMLDEARLRASLYCYSNQKVPEITAFWSRLLTIPESQFTKAYVRNDYRADARKMTYGLVHIRYSDKKLLRDLLNLIESYKFKYASVG